MSLLPIIAGIVLAFCTFAVIFRGYAAYKGITWGLNKEVASPSEKANPCSQKTLDDCFVQTHINIGIYDPRGKLKNSDKFAFEHEFISWVKYKPAQFLDFLNRAAKKNRWPIVTIEPFADEEKKRTKVNLFSDILEGQYDNQIDAICRDIETFGKPVFIRWGHEMENVTGRYPWAQDDAKGFIKVYTYFVDRCKTITSFGYYVWSPAGNKNLGDYWPGREYVDYIGLSVFIYPEWEIKHYKYVRSFQEIFNEKYELVKKYERPIMIAEFGVAGEKSSRENMILQAFKDMTAFPLLKTASFFNEKDSPMVWGDDLAIPDWSIDQNLLDHISVKSN